MWKNVRKSNWIISPEIGVKLKNVWKHHQKGVESWGHIYHISKPSWYNRDHLCFFLTNEKRMVQNRSPSSMFFVTTKLESPDISSLSKYFPKKKSHIPTAQHIPPPFCPKKKGPAHPKSKASQEHSTLRHRVHLMGVENPPRCRMLQLPKT